MIRVHPLAIWRALLDAHFPRASDFADGPSRSIDPSPVPAETLLAAPASGAQILPFRRPSPAIVPLRPRGAA